MIERISSVAPRATIAATARTPVGRAHKGVLAAARPEDLLAHTIRAVLTEAPGLDPGAIDDVIVGCAFPQDKQGMNIARRTALLAGLPATVPGTTVNRFCASSLQAIRIAVHAVCCGEGDVFLAAGVESLSQVNGYPSDEDKHPSLTGRSGAVANAYVPMGVTAENVAARYAVSREEMDRFAQRSHERAIAAQEARITEREIAPFALANGTVVSADDGPRPNSSIERLGELEPVFREAGTVTAGNACPLNDGAAAVLVMSERAANRYGVKPRARFVASAVSGIEPEYMGVGPIDAVGKALDRARMTIEDIDVVELNEAFAAQVLPVCWELGIDPFGDSLNPHGGAIAIGHPFGMTGARIMGALLNDLETLDGQLGLETMCIGGGQGMAMIVERLSGGAGA